MTESEAIAVFKKQMQKRYPTGFFYKIPDGYVHLGGEKMMSQRKPFDMIGIVAGLVTVYEFKKHVGDGNFPCSKFAAHQIEGLRQAFLAGAEACGVIAWQRAAGSPLKFYFVSLADLESGGGIVLSSCVEFRNASPPPPAISDTSARV